jgi:hypothetical protein
MRLLHYLRHSRAQCVQPTDEFAGGVLFDAIPRAEQQGVFAAGDGDRSGDGVAGRDPELVVLFSLLPGAGSAFGDLREV